MSNQGTVKNIEGARQLRRQETPTEKALWQAIRNSQLGVKFRRQYPIPQTLYVVDFYCHQYRLIIEIDGKIHEQQQAEDVIRQSAIEALGYRFLRFTTDEVEQTFTQVIASIKQFCQVSSSL